jgi:hypothetical protein
MKAQKPTLNENFIKNHFFLSEPDAATGTQHFSSLTGAIRAARETTGRDVSTGEKKTGEPHGNWLGVLGYFTVLDQVGSCFQRISSSSSSKGVPSALKQFTNLNQADIKALYALRCSFAHDFSLFNKNEKRPDLWHRFVVLANNEYPLIKLPEKPWDGDIFTDSPDVFTVVNLEKLGDLVEDVFRTLIELAKDNKLQTRSKCDPNEISAKYWHSVVFPEKLNSSEATKRAAKHERK